MYKKVMLTKEFQHDFYIMESVQIYPIPFIYLFKISLWSLLITRGKLDEIKGLGGEKKQHHCPHNYYEKFGQQSSHRYVNLLYYKQPSLLYVSATYCGHLNGGAL
jgi:hypothetical protein